MSDVADRMRSVGTRTRVCVLVPGHWSAVMGGAQYQAKCLTDTLLDRPRYSVSYLARNADAKYRPVGYDLVRLSNPFNRRQGYIFLDAADLYKALRRIRPHVIYQRVGCSYAGVAAWYCRRNPAKLVWHIADDMEVQPFRFSVKRSTPHRYVDKKLLEYGIRHADAIVAQTRQQAVLLERHYGRSPDEIIPNFHPLPERPADKSGPLQVVWIANLKEKKRPLDFVRLVQTLGGETPAKFLMIGELQGGDRWQQKVKRHLERTPRLEYLGRRPQEEVNEILSRSHLLVNTSAWEGFSNTFIQAWMREVPVVSLSVNPDGVFDSREVGVCGRDFEGLVRETRHLLENSKQRAMMGRAARRHAERWHSPDNANRLVALLDRLAA